MIREQYSPTIIVVADKNIENAMAVMQDQLNIAAKWCHDNGLIITATKTNVMHIKLFASFNIHIKFHNNECLHKRAKR